MEPQLSHAAGKAAMWMMQEAITATRGMPWQERIAKLNEANAHKDLFVAACHEARTLDQVPGWCRELMEQAGALPHET